MSILTSVKQALGIVPEYTIFDSDLIMHINSTFSILNQMGAGPKEGFEITSDVESWNLYSTNINHNLIKTYMFKKVKTMFDPPSISAVVQALNQSIEELEWRITLAVETTEQPEEGGVTNEL